MIFSAYPTIGKTTLAKKRQDIIDLESSCFDKNNPNWYIDYCKTAIDLESQGYIVFVSSHKPVQDYMVANHNDNYMMILYQNNMKDYVIKKAEDRYERSEKKEKDLRALERIRDHFEEDNAAIAAAGMKRYRINSEDYNLEEIVDALNSNYFKISRMELNNFLTAIERVCDLILKENKFVHPKDQKLAAASCKKTIETYKDKGDII